MPLRRRCVLVALFVLAGIALADAEELSDRTALTFNTYRDNAETTILTTTLKIVKKISGPFGLGVDFGYDAISTATPAPGAGPPEEEGTFTDKEPESERYFPTLRGIYDDGRNALTLGGYYSRERNYRGASLFIDYTRLLNMENTALGAGLSQSWDEWTLDEDFRLVLPEDEKKDTQVSLSASQFLSLSSKIQLTYTYAYTEGLIASPYRSLPIGETVVGERLPRVRKGHALTAKTVTLLNDPTSVILSYRYYCDDWDIRSHTAAVELYRDLSESLTVGGVYRYYTQRGAEFTRPLGDHAFDDEYVVVDYKYSDFHSQTAGLAVIYVPEWGFSDNRIKIKASLDYYRTSTNPRIRNWYGVKNLKAVLFTTGVDYSF